MIIFAKICKSNNYKGFILLFVHLAEKSIGCDEERFTSPEECASAPSFRFTKECL